MSLVVMAAFLYALGTAFYLAAFAALTQATVGTSSGLGHASEWLWLAGGAAALVAVCAAGWELVLRRAWAGVWEVSAGAVGTLLIAIGMLVSALGDSGADVLSAVGIGVWALLVLSHAARCSLAEQQTASDDTTTLPHQAGLWLLAAIGLAFLAVGWGLTPSVTSKGLGIAAGVIEAVGVAALFGALAAARARGSLPSHPVPLVLAGLAILVAHFVAVAIVSGVVFGPDVTLTGVRVGVSIATGIGLAAIVILGLAAWTRVRELAVASSPSVTLSSTSDT